MNAVQQAAVRKMLAEIEGFTNLSFSEVSGGAGVLRWGETTTVKDAETTSAWGYRPGTNPGENGGDAWFNLSGNAMYDSPKLGNRAYATFMHELGHQLGLKHPHQDMTAFDPMPRDYDNRNYSVMSYERVSGGDVQSYMQLDIAALQHMYGADFTTNGGNTVYRFSNTTGEFFIDGMSQGVPVKNEVLRTIWDGGGTDTYDLSNYTTALKIDLNPGAFSTFGTQLVAGAKGNLANALLYKGDARSLIENVKGGSGNDTIVGNQAANRLEGGAGADTLTGGAGSDTFVLRKESTPDTIRDATAGDRIDVTAWALSAGQLTIVQDGTRWVVTGDQADERAYFATAVTADQFVGLSGASAPTPTPTPTPAPTPAPTPVPTDKVYDFNSASEANNASLITTYVKGDRFDLSTIDADVTEAGDQAFTFLGKVGSSAFTDAGEQIRYRHDLANNQTQIYGSNDHDSYYEFRIEIKGLHDFTAADFIL
ncbi:hypothetical protein GR304_03925 [Microvirga sp. SYSU G3D207]|uniref:M10 family metallopeptidase n=1 Tax=Microvirga arsenatis TaxID=2692265 RepID=UPI0013781B2F|nr:M10 family metallopeptidase [Microvirga arsenatis]NBJ10058.1 hypothetical protein [Microvirga arsenatis]